MKLRKAAVLLALLFLPALHAGAGNFNVVYFDPDGNLVRIADILSYGRKYFGSIDPGINFIVIVTVIIDSSTIAVIRVCRSK